MAPGISLEAKKLNFIQQCVHCKIGSFSKSVGLSSSKTNICVLRINKLQREYLNLLEASLELLMGMSDTLIIQY